MLASDPSTPDLQRALDRVIPGIDALLGTHARDNQHIKAWEQFCKCVDNEPLLSWKEIVPPNRMGVHHRNRSGLGIVGAHCMTLGSANIANGYSFAMACRDATASSCPPISSKNNWHAFNVQLNARQSSPPLVAPLGLSLGAGHGNGFCRQVIAQAACSIKAIAPSGFLDPVMLARENPGLAKALEGLEWRMLHYTLFDRYPALADIIQKALNSKNMQACSEVEGLLCMAASAANMGPSIAWDMVADQATASKPTWHPWVQQMLKVVKATPLELIEEMATNMSSMVLHV